MSLIGHWIDQQFCRQGLAVLTLIIIVLALPLFKYSLRHLLEVGVLERPSDPSQQTHLQILQTQDSRFKQLYKHFVVSYSWFEPCSSFSNSTHKLCMLCMASLSILTVILLCMRSVRQEKLGLEQLSLSPADIMQRIIITLVVLDCYPLLDYSLKLTMHLKKSQLRLKQRKVSSLSIQTTIESLSHSQNNLNTCPDTNHRKQHSCHIYYIAYTVSTVYAAVAMCLASLVTLLHPLQTVETIQHQGLPSLSSLVILPICWLIYPVSLLAIGYFVAFLTNRVLSYKFDDRQIRQICYYILELDHLLQNGKKVTLSIETLPQSDPQKLNIQSDILQRDCIGSDRHKSKNIKTNNNMFFCIEEESEYQSHATTFKNKVDQSPLHNGSVDKHASYFEQIRQSNRSAALKPSTAGLDKRLQIQQYDPFQQKDMKILYESNKNIMRSKKGLENNYFKSINRYKSVYTSKGSHNMNKSQCQNQIPQQPSRTISHHFAKKHAALKIRELSNDKYSFQNNEIVQLSHPNRNQPYHATNSIHKLGKHYDDYVFVDLGVARNLNPNCNYIQSDLLASDKFEAASPLNFQKHLKSQNRVRKVTEQPADCQAPRNFESM